MNKERMLQLADVIEKLPHVQEENKTDPGRSFTMNDFSYECGTPACIAGWATALATGKENIQEFAPCSTAARWLEIDVDWADNLFMPDVPLRRITPQMAATVLRTLAEKGEELPYDDMQDLWEKVMK